MSPQHENRLELLQLAPPNRWIAISHDESNIVAVGESYSEVAILSELAGIYNPVILKTPETQSMS